MSKHDIERLFPDLLRTGYSITSPTTPDYNCIAWAADDTEAWWWPDPQYSYYWPPGIPREESTKSFIKAYENLGYFICSDAKYENGFEKIAIYVNSNGKPSHAARQLSSEKWTSKLGRLEDIEHQTLDNIEGANYGTVAVILKRHKKEA